jgi:hypothetical protein
VTVASQPDNNPSASANACTTNAATASYDALTSDNVIPQSFSQSSQCNGEPFSWDSSYSTIQVVVKTEGFDRVAEEEILSSDPYEYIELFQGCHPFSRNEPQPHSIYPIAKVYENLSNDSPHTVFRLLWDISLHERLVEDMPQSVFQSIRHANPKLLWMKDGNVALGANKSLFPSVFGSTSSTMLGPSSSVNCSSSSNGVNQSSNSVSSVIDLSGGADNDAGGDHDDGHSGVDGEDVVVITDVLPPTDRVKIEKDWYNDLKSLYADPFKKPYVKIDIGGRGVMLNSFHYEEPENDFTVGKRNKKFEYIDIVDNVLLYRWEIKGCITNTTNIGGRKMIERVYFALCRYQPLDSSNTRIYDCLAIQITRCKDRVPLFLMKEVGVGNASKIECWQGWHMIKHFYAVPEVTIPVESLLEERLQYWKCNNFLYRPDQKFLLDTKSPGTRTQLDTTLDQIQRAEKYWSVKSGPKPATTIDLHGHHTRGTLTLLSSDGAEINHSLSTSSSGNEKLKYAAELKKAEDRIKTLTKQVELMKQQKKNEKKPSKAVKTNDRNDIVVEKLKAELLALKNDNKMLKAELKLFNSKRAHSPPSEHCEAEQRPLTIRRSCKQNSKSIQDDADADLEYQEKRNKAARLSLDTSRIQREQSIVKSKQEQLDLLTLQRTQILADKMLERSDEDRQHQKHVSILELEHRHRRDLNKDVLRMANTANDPVNLHQVLNHKRTVNEASLKAPILEKYLEQLIKSGYMSSDGSSTSKKKRKQNTSSSHLPPPVSSAPISNSNVTEQMSGTKEELGSEIDEDVDHRVAVMMEEIAQQRRKAEDYRHRLEGGKPNSDVEEQSDSEEDN